MVMSMIVPMENNIKSLSKSHLNLKDLFQLHTLMRDNWEQRQQKLHWNSQGSLALIYRKKKPKY